MTITVTEPMFNTGGPREDLRRCPDCHKLPQLLTEDKGPERTDFIFFCEQHGHFAKGQTIEMAVAHWNIYAMAFRREVA